LRENGASVPPAEMPSEDRAVVDVPDGWRTSRFFQLAQQHDVVLTQLKPQEESLHDLFFRMTAG